MYTNNQSRSPAEASLLSSRRKEPAPPSVAAPVARQDEDVSFTAAETDDIPSRNTRAALMGRLTDGTMHRQSFIDALLATPSAAAREQQSLSGDEIRKERPSREWEMPAGLYSATVRFEEPAPPANAGAPAAAKATSDNGQTLAEREALAVALVEETARSGTWAAQFPSADAMRAAVTTTKDAQSDFEAALIEEINLLRRDPKAYAVIFEREATLGYPFVCGSDEYFDTDAAAETVHSYRPEVLGALLPKRGSMLSGNATTPPPFFGTSVSSIAASAAGGYGARPLSADRESATSGGRAEEGSPGRASNGGNGRRSRPRSSGASGRESSSGSRQKRSIPNGGRSAASPSPNTTSEGHSSASGAGGGRDEAMERDPHTNETHSRSAYDARGGGVPHDDAYAAPLLFRATLKSYGMSTLNLAQLRTHFRRHQRHRTALEKAMKEIALGWQLAQQAQKEAWAAEDEKASKRTKRGNAGASTTGGGAGGGSISNNSNRKRSAVNAMGNPAEVFAVRKAATEALNSAFAAQLREVYKELEAEREACRRAMDGANVIIDCVRALREAPPAPPLRLSSGLTLAAREASTTFHASETRVAAIAETQRVMAARGSRPTRRTEDPLLAMMHRADDATASTPGAPGTADGGDGDGKDGVRVTFGGREAAGSDSRAHRRDGSHEDADEGEDEAAKTAMLLEIMLQQLDPANQLSATGGADRGNRKASHENSNNTHDGGDVRVVADTLAALHLDPSTLRQEVAELAQVSQASCGLYGYVSGEVRGLQLYGAGSPRTLVMQALLGVAEPVFGFTENARNLRANDYPSADKPNTPIHARSRPTDGAAQVSLNGTAGPGTLSSNQAPTSLDARLYSKSIFHPSNQYTLSGVNGPETVDVDENSLPPPLPSPPSVHDAERTAATALVLCGELHPTTRHAAHHFTRHEEAQTTTAGRRAAQAVQRLGPLLWPDAHLAGCAWQRVEPQRTVPSYEENLAHLAGEGDGFFIPEDHPLLRMEAGGSGCLVGTTLLIASGYEELDLVRQQASSAGLSAIRRTVLERVADTVRGSDHAASQGTVGAHAMTLFNDTTRMPETEQALNVRRPFGPASTGPRFNADATGTASARGGLPAVVDMHSSLGVELLAPLTHPLHLSCSALSSGAGIVVIAAKADPLKVQLQACVTAAVAGSPIPRAPVLDSELVLVQRSPDHAEVTLILVDAKAVAARLSALSTDKEARVPGAREALVHIYEAEKSGSAVALTTTAPGTDSSVPRIHDVAPVALVDAVTATTSDASTTDVSGYEHIGFIRLVLNDDGGTNAATTLTGSAARSVPLLRHHASGTGRGTMVLSSPSAAPPLFAAGLDFSSRDAVSPGSAAPTPLGWPTLSQDFADRCASLITPLTAHLPAGGEGGAAGAVRVAVRVPTVQHSHYLHRHIAALLAQLARLQAAQDMDEAGSSSNKIAGDSSMSTHEQPQPPALLAPSDTAAAVDGTPPPAASEAAGTDSDGTRELTPTPPPQAAKPARKSTVRKSGAAAAGAGAKKTVPPHPRTTRTAKKGEDAKQPSPSAASARSFSAPECLAGGEGSDSGGAGLSPELHAMLLTPTAHFRERGYFDVEFLSKVGLRELREAVAALGTAAAECQGRLQRAKGVLEGELERLRAEAERRRGRELLRVKHEEGDVVKQLAEADVAVAELVKGAEAARDVLLRRNRDRALRSARLVKLRKELAELQAREVGQSAHLPQHEVPDREAKEPAAKDVVLWLCAPGAAPGPEEAPRNALPSTLTAVPPASSRGGATLTTSPGAVRNQTSGALVVAPQDRIAHTYATGHSYFIPLLPCSAESASTGGGGGGGEAGATDQDVCPLYEATFHISDHFRGGRAMLLINGTEAVAWRIL